MKIRLSNQLLARAHVCAEDVGTTLYDWAGRALRQYRTGKLPRVADLNLAKDATRMNSTVSTLPGEQSEADEMRLALFAAVAYCESQRPPPFISPLVEGVHYIVEKEEVE